MFDFGNANKYQRKAISTTDGPVLIIAGPGTGKTYTLVQRTIYLIKECNVDPKSIFIATFTNKAAKELVTRITNELLNNDISVNIGDMYVGTFHSLCLRIIDDYREFTRLRKNYRVLDSFDQQYMVFQHIGKFRDIPEFETVFSEPDKWNQAKLICDYVNKLSEELINPDDLIIDSDFSISVLGKTFKTYQNIIEEENVIDFSSIQVEAYNLLFNHSEILQELHSNITHIMVDEYQDTNFIQEQLIFLISGNKNICVVGDDDQGLYRFRGATIRNILEFPQKFQNGECHIIHLIINYRSNNDIVDFYNEWMSDEYNAEFDFKWDNFRYKKTVKASDSKILNSPAVVKLSSEDNVDEWHDKILNFIQSLKNSGKLTDYNQIAFLFRSVKNENVILLAQFLEENNISVYSPRSNMFFKRKEIQVAIGCLILMFPQYDKSLKSRNFPYIQPVHYDYYDECISAANEYIIKVECTKLFKFIQQTRKIHAGLKGTTDYTYSGLLYQLFAYPPFLSILDMDAKAGLVDIRPVRNLARLTHIIGKFEYLYHIDVLDSKKYRGKRSIDSNTEILFNLYLRLLFDGGITEYEDDSEYAPSGCVSFLTIHQAKGMEFPIVFVDSLANVPKKDSNDLMAKIELKYSSRRAFEPYGITKYYDFKRLYYTAFSRAQNLLILTCNERQRTPSKYFKGLYSKLKSVDDPIFNLKEFDFKPVKKVNIKNIYSFSHIAVFETCELQYKFYKELDFLPIRTNAILFGTVVHETIEDIHHAVLCNKELSINDEKIKEWFNSNYSSLISTEHTYLSATQLEAALKHVLNYAHRQDNNWIAIKEAEMTISLVKPDYIVEGRVDLIKKDNNLIDVVDFKSQQKKEVLLNKEQLEYYQKQLNIYAYLVEKKTGQKVNRLCIYFTGDNDDDPVMTFPYEESSIDETMAQFDKTVKRIEQKQFYDGAKNLNVCKNCDFHFYCRTKKGQIERETIQYTVNDSNPEVSDFIDDEEQLDIIHKENIFSRIMSFFKNLSIK